MLSTGDKLFLVILGCALAGIGYDYSSVTFGLTGCGIIISAIVISITSYLDKK